MKKKISAIFIALIAVVLLGASCSATKQPADQSTNTNTQSVDINQGEVKTFDLNAFNFGYSVKEIRVKKGDKVKIVLTSTNGFHDWTVEEFDAASSRVNTGDITSVEFTASKIGTFEYYCSVGTHRQQGMVGKLIVE